MGPAIIRIEMSMRGVILYGTIDSSEIHILVSGRAMTYLEESGSSIYVGMELYFTYFMQKKVAFRYNRPDHKVTKITDNIFLYFRAVESRNCKIKELKGDDSDLISLPITKQGALVPKFLKVDYQKGKWSGEFTWKTGNYDFKPLLLNYN